MYKLKVLWQLLWARHFYVVAERQGGARSYRARACANVVAQLQHDANAIEIDAEIRAVIEYAFENPELTDIDEVLHNLRQRYVKRDGPQFDQYAYHEAAKQLKKEFEKIKPRN